MRVVEFEEFERKLSRILAADQSFCTSARGQCQLFTNYETAIIRMIKRLIPIREHCVQLRVENIIGNAPIYS